MRRTARRLSLALFVGAPCAAFAQTSAFTPLGIPAGASMSQAVAISADGSTVVGSTSTQAFKWTSVTGITILPGSSAFARGASTDGAIIVGRANGTAARWNSGVLQNLGNLPGGSQSYGIGVSADGSTVCGFGTVASGAFHAFRWTSSGFLDLGTLPGGGGGVGPRAAGISADGSVIVGTDLIGGPSARESSFRWTAQTGMQEIIAPAGFRDAICAGVSGDGLTVVGQAQFPGLQAYRWNSGSGSIALDLPVGWTSSFALSASFDGSVTGGYIRAAFDHAAIWDAAGHASDLNTLLPQLGVPLTGWTLTAVYGISPDGRTLVGVGTNPAGATEGWVATIPSPSAAAIIALAATLAPHRRRRSPS